jgi:hypothetical protein
LVAVSKAQKITEYVREALKNHDILFFSLCDLCVLCGFSTISINHRGHRVHRADSLRASLAKSLAGMPQGNQAKEWLLLH